MARLPNLEKGKKYGFDLSNYYAKKLHELLNLFDKNGVAGDGKLNAFNREIIGDFNVYLEQSKELIYRIVIAENLLPGTVESYNLCGIRKSLAKQRGLIKAAKSVVKKQGIDKEWYDLFQYTLKKMYERMQFVENGAIKFNTETTELDIYLRELEIQGITFAEDMENRLTMEEPDEYGNVLDKNGELMEAYIEHVKGVIDRSVLSEEEKTAYLAKKERQENFRTEKLKKIQESKEAEKQKWYEDTCSELMANAYMAERRLIAAYKNNKQFPRLVNLEKELSKSKEGYCTVFVCRKRKGRNSATYLSGYQDGIHVTSNIKQCLFVPASETATVEKMLKEEDVAYGCYHIDGGRLQYIFDCVGYEPRVIYSRTNLFFDKRKDGTYREDASDYIKGASLEIKEEYGMFTIYLQKSGEEKLVGLSESLTGAKTRARNYAIDYRCKKNLDIPEEEILKELDKRVTKSPLYKNYTEALGI